MFVCQLLFFARLKKIKHLFYLLMSNFPMSNYDSAAAGASAFASAVQTDPDRAVAIVVVIVPLLADGVQTTQQ